MALTAEQVAEVVDGLVLATDALVPGGLKDRELGVLTAFATAVVLSGVLVPVTSETTT